jgi:hypothetical protein
MIQCCIMIGWTYLESSSFILFALSLEWLVTKIPKGIFCSYIFLCSIHKDIKAKGESSCYLSKVLALGQSSSLGNLLIALLIGEVVSPPTPTFMYLSQDSHYEICNIYDKHMHLQPPFQSL